MDPPSCSIPIPRLESLVSSSKVSIVKKGESICYRHRYYCTYRSTRRESRTGMYGIFCGVNKKAVRTFQTFTRWVRFGFLKDLFSFLRSRKGRKGLEMGVLSWFFVTILRTDDWLPLRINIQYSYHPDSQYWTFVFHFILICIGCPYRPILHVSLFLHGQRCLNFKLAYASLQDFKFCSHRIWRRKN